MSAVSAAAAVVLLSLYPLMQGSEPLGLDLTGHLLSISYLAAMLENGDVTLWMPLGNLGYPLLLYYQPLPHVVMALLYVVLKPFVSLLVLFKLSILFLFSAIPIAFYWGARRIGFRGGIALLAAMLAPTLNSPFFRGGWEIGAALGTGLYAQLFAMIWLPLAIGSMVRYVEDGRGLLRATLLLSLTFLSHVVFGTMAVAIGAIYVLAMGAGLLTRATRLATIYGCFLPAVAFFVVPLMLQIDYLAGWPSIETYRLNGIGVQAFFKALVQGQLFDFRRAPIVTLLFTIGFVVSLMRTLYCKDRLARFLLLSLVLFTVLLMGRTTFGPMIDWIPLVANVPLLRYIAGFHWAAILVAGVGAAALVRVVVNLTSRKLVVLVIAGLVFPLYFQHSKVMRLVTGTIEQQKGLDRGDLIAMSEWLKKQPEGRYAVARERGFRSHWVLSLPALYSGKPAMRNDAKGTHDSLSYYYVLMPPKFFPRYRELFNLRYLVSKGERADFNRIGPVAFREGDFVVYEVQGGGYFSLVDVAAVVVGKNEHLRPLLRYWMRSPLFDRGIFLEASFAATQEHRSYANRLTLGSDGLPLVAVVGGKPRELASGEAFFGALAVEHTAIPKGALGKVSGSSVGVGRFMATAQLTRPCTLLLKATYHPNWHVLVDGEERRPKMISPSLLGVSLDKGTHQVEFYYRSHPSQKILAAFAPLWLVAIGLWERRQRRVVRQQPVEA